MMTQAVKCVLHKCVDLSLVRGSLVPMNKTLSVAAPACLQRGQPV